MSYLIPKCQFHFLWAKKVLFCSTKKNSCLYVKIYSFLLFLLGVTQIRFSATDEYFCAFRKFNGDGAVPSLWQPRDVVACTPAPLSHFMPSLFIAFIIPDVIQLFSFVASRPALSLFYTLCGMTLPQLIRFIIRFASYVRSPCLCIFAADKARKEIHLLMTKVASDRWTHQHHFVSFSELFIFLGFLELFYYINIWNLYWYMSLLFWFLIRYFLKNIEIFFMITSCLYTCLFLSVCLCN